MGDLMNFERSCDWDLQAIVKGETKVISNIIKEIPPSYDWLEEYYHNQENATLLLNELHQICNPNFVNVSHNNSSSKIVDNTVIGTVDDDTFVKGSIEEPKEKNGGGFSEKKSTIARKRRKNKHKKIFVEQSKGDRILSDKWNWRKYGEKVIKGSPYPRSYYRCSNPGGCLARKQVELSYTNPGKFLITYIEEHNHAYPSRRPSQAGRTSRRAHASWPSSEHVHGSSSRSSATLPSIIAEDKKTVHWNNKIDNNNNRSLYVSNGVIDDDFFVGLEGIEINGCLCIV